MYFNFRVSYNNIRSKFYFDKNGIDIKSPEGFYLQAFKGNGDRKTNIYSIFTL